MSGNQTAFLRGKRGTMLASLLGFTAGFVDVAGFIALSSLFTAHLTGNLVLLGVTIATGLGGALVKALALPTFILVVALTTLMTRRMERFGRPPLVPVLVAELLLLAGFLMCGVRALPLQGPDDAEALAVAFFGVAAMSVQNGLMRCVLVELPATTVMTVALTQVIVDLVDWLLGGERASAAVKRLSRMIPVVCAFGAGAGLSGLGYLWYGLASVVAPLAALLVAITVAIPARSVVAPRAM